MYYLLNPLNKTVTARYDGYGDIELPPEEISEFDNETIFNHARKYLVDAIINQRGLVGYDHVREEIEKEVTKKF